MKRPHFSIGIRSKLLLASSVLLAIPWLGYEYVRELERFLRQAQEQRIAGTAQAVATALHDRPRLFERLLQQPQSLPEARQDETFDDEPAQSVGELTKPRTQPTAPGSTAEIEQILRGLSRTTARIWVIDRNLRVLARAGSLRQPAQTYEESVQPSFGLASLWHRFDEAVLHPLFSPLYRLILKQPSEDFVDDLAQASHLHSKEVEGALSGILSTRRWLTSDERAGIISSAHPIWVGDIVLGAVVVEETTNPVLAQRNRAFERLFNVVLAVLLASSLTLFLFASNLSARIRRLRNEAEHAVDARGRIQEIVTGSGANDEIGDLSRSFSEVLTRLAQYTSYQENMATRLSHELRTPIAVVRSSLENLDLQPLPEEAKVYMERARQGLHRLNHILTSMTEATRLDQILRDADREQFDLRQLIAGCVEGYRIVYPQQQFALQLPDEPVLCEGIPDAIAQMLDKLIANAVDFSHAHVPVEVSLVRSERTEELAVKNRGFPLPESMQERLFQSMVSLRPHKSNGVPHLGLGLYIVRLIAEFHGGTAGLINRTDVEGVVAIIRLPTFERDK